MKPNNRCKNTGNTGNTGNTTHPRLSGQMKAGALSPETDDAPKIRNGIILFFLYFFILCVVAITFDRISKNKYGFSQHTFVLSFGTIFIFTGILIFLFGGGNLDGGEMPAFFSGISITTRVLFGLFAVVVLIMIMYFSFISYYIFVAILIFIVVVGLAIIFNIFHNNILRSSKNTYFKFILEFIFFLPCLLNDAMLWILGEFKLTPYVTYILLFIEALLVLSYFYAPLLFKKVAIRDGKKLLDEPYYINTGFERVIATSADLFMGDPTLLTSINAVNPYSKDYAFSLWINLNPQNISSSTELPIFRYGYIEPGTAKKTQYKPGIFYTYDNNLKKDVYKVYFTGDGGDGGMTKIHVPNQRWNQFTLNYVDGERAELWVNGVLNNVVNFDNTTATHPIYDVADQVIVGNTKESGINGAICGVEYYNKSLTPTQIANIYNLGIITQPYPGK